MWPDVTNRKSPIQPSEMSHGKQQKTVYCVPRWPLTLAYSRPDMSDCSTVKYRASPVILQSCGSRTAEWLRGYSPLAYTGKFTGPEECSKAWLLGGGRKLDHMTEAAAQTHQRVSHSIPRIPLAERWRLVSTGADKIAQWVKTLSTTSDDPSLRPRSYMVKEENKVQGKRLQQGVLASAHMCGHTNINK